MDAISSISINCKNCVPILTVIRRIKVGKNDEIVRRQFHIRPCAAKTSHHVQGETVTTVVDFGVISSKLQIPFFQHVHFVGLSRVTILDGRHILDLNEDKIGVNEDVKADMQHFGTTGAYLTTAAIYSLSESFVVCYNNARSLHKHY